MLRIATASGSVYHICLRSNTWAHVKHATYETRVRTDHGTFKEIGEVRVGRELVLICPAIDPRCAFRIIQTTIVIDIRHIVGPHDKKMPLMLADIPAEFLANLNPTGENPGPTPLT
jgi:hypothetical protein